MRKLKGFYEKHKEVIDMACVTAGSIAVVYTVMTPFMILWKRLGLYNK